MMRSPITLLLTLFYVVTAVAQDHRLEAVQSLPETSLRVVVERDIWADFSSTQVANGRIDDELGILRAAYRLSLDMTPESTLESTVRSWLARDGEDFGIGAPEALQLVQKKETYGAHHLTFQQTLAGVPVYGRYVHVNLNRAGLPVMAISGYAPHLERVDAFHPVPALSAAQAESLAQRAVSRDGAISTPAELLVLPGHPPRLVWRTVAWPDDTLEEWEVLLDANTGELIQLLDQRVHSHAHPDPPPSKVDGEGQVWLYDPLTASGESYEGDYTDNDDKNNEALSALLQTVTLQDIEQGDDGNYRLRGPWVRITGEHAPVESDPKDFKYTRDNKKFEAVMVYYYVDMSERYVQSLGVGSSPPSSPVSANPHASFSNSAFYLPASRSLHFGYGGIDSAEDAGVILHEYGHAIMHHHLGFSTSPTGEWGVLGEGFADYWAVSYRRDLMDRGLVPAGDWRQVFPWDGNTWGGRRVDGNLDYRKIQRQCRIGCSVHLLGKTWANLMMKLWERIGRANADRLHVAGFSYLGRNNFKLPDMVEALVTADKALNNGQYAADIRTVFGQNGFVAPEGGWPVISISGGEAVTEGSSASFTLSATPAPRENLDISVTVSQTGTFTESTELGTREVMIGTSGTAAFDVNTVNDVVDEDNGAIQVTIQSSADYEIADAPDHTASVTVEDDDAPVISISSGGAVTEGSGASFTLSAKPAPGADLAVSVMVTQTGTFTESTELGTQEVTIGTSGTAAFEVDTVNDVVDEDNGAILVTIQSGTGYEIAEAPDHTASVAIEDDDVPVIGISGGDAVAEGGSASFTFSATPVPRADLAVSIMVSQTGMFTESTELGTQEVTIGTSGTAAFDVDTVNDVVDEDNGAIQVTIQSGTGYEIAEVPDHTASVTIEDDDIPVIRISGGEAVTEGSIASFTLGATPAPRAELDISVTVSQTGTFVESTELGTQEVTIGTSGTAAFDVDTVNDVVDEDNGAIQVAIQSGTGYEIAEAPDHTASVTIEDNDIPVIRISGGEAVTEGSSASFTLSATPAPGTNLDINLMIEQTGLFAASTKLGTQEVMIGSSGTATFAVDTVNDVVDEADGSIQATIQSGTGYEAAEAPNYMARVTVKDNDISISATVPDAPGGLRTAVSGKNQIRLSWTAPNDGGTPLTGYRIEGSADAGGTWSDLVANTGNAATIYMHQGLTPNTTWYYRVSAINSVGTGPASNVANATTETATAPMSPTRLIATALGESQINLSWTAPLNAGGTAITGYQIEVSLNAGTIWSMLVTNTGNAATTYAHTDLTPSTAYHYRVRAINSVGTGSVSNVVSATTKAPPATAPTAPSGLSATASGSSQIDLSWVAPSNTGVAAIIGYQIELSADAGTNWSDLAANTGNASTTYTHTGLSPETTRHYRVSAMNSIGTGPVSNMAHATTDAPLPPPIFPDAPTGLSAIASGGGQINLSWTAPSNTGGESITGYKIEISADVGRSWTDLIANTGSAVTAYAHTGLAPGTTRHYRISAMNSAGTGPASNVAHAMTEPPVATVPDAPTGLRAVASGESQINLSWTAPSSGGAVLTGYRIEVSTNTGTQWRHLISNTGSAATTYAHTGLAPNTTRYYRVSAVNSVGIGPASNVAHATTGTHVVIVTVPDAPTGLSAIASGSSQINLSWTAPSSTGGAVITDYQIEISFDAGTNWPDLAANTGGAATTYVHTELMPGTTYHYRVSAINAAGTGPVSNMANATTDIHVSTNEDAERPQSVTLHGNYPNPSSETTNLIFDLPESAKIEVAVTDLLGRTVINTSERQFGPGREHTLAINISGLSNGIYNCTMVSVMRGQTVVHSIPMVVVR